MHFIENIVPYQKRANLAPSKTTDRASSSLRSRVERKKQHIRAWEGNDPSRKRRVYFGCYTAAFIVVAFITLFVYPSNGRALIWNIDGIEQYYPFFVYEGQWLREIVSNLLSGQGLQIPLWVHELGYGMDVPSTLDTFFDPLNLLSGLCPERYSEYLFQFLVVFRLYLAGAAFSLLALRFKIGRFPTLVGALLYALCGTAMAVAYWPAGAWPLVLFPLLLLGVEKVIAKERPYTFIAAVAAFFIISYYFSYMACLLLLPYCAVRVFQTQKSVNAVRFLGWTLRFFGLLAIGVLIACFALVPSLVGLFGLERFTDNSVTVPLFYSHHYYTSLASGFLSMAGVGSDCYIGFGGLAFLSCVLLFSKRRQNTSLKIAFVAGTIMLMVPAVGSFLNGMNYATNRWVWAYALVVCFIVARMLPSMLHLDKRSVKVLVIASIAYGAIVFAVAPMRTEAMLAAGVVLAATLFVVAQRGMAAKTRRMAVVCCLTAGLTVNAFYFVSPDEGGVGKLSSPLGYAYPRITSDSPNHLVSDLNAPGLWRYDGSSSAIERTRNDSLVLGLKGFDFYNSSYNSAIDDFHTELALNRTNINFSYNDLGGRAILESLMGVKYYLSTKAGFPPVYLYDDPNKIVASGVVRDIPYQVHEGSNVLPLAFAYDSYVPRSEYLSLSPVQRQEALLQGVVLDESSLPATDRKQESRTVPSVVSASNGLSVEDGVIRVLKPGATLTLSFEGIANSETYFYVDGLHFKGVSPVEESKRKGEFDNLAWFRKALLLQKDMNWTEPRRYNIGLGSDKAPGMRQIDNYTNASHLYGGKDEWLVNMGYSKEPQTSITLHFDLKGDYRFTNMSVVCQPVKNMSNRIDALKADPVEDLKFGTNEITASIDASKPKALFLSVPYSKGWTATVDGKPAEIKRANTAFMALELEPGHHEIELRYLTPGLREGMILSGIGLAALAGLALVRRILSTRVRRAQTTASASARADVQASPQRQEEHERNSR